MADPVTPHLVVREFETLDDAVGEVMHLRAILDERDEDIRALRKSHVHDAQFIERLERANSTLHQAFADEQRERELLMASISNALGELSEYFRQANQLRGRGTPRADIHTVEPRYRVVGE